MMQVGNEFGSVEALWSQFENVMAKDSERAEEGKDVGDGLEEGAEKDMEQDETMKPDEKA